VAGFSEVRPGSFYLLLDLMDVRSLIARAGHVRQAIFASLPFWVRFAHVYTTIVADVGWLADLGRHMGAEMLLAGVTDMPDPGPKWDPSKGINAWKTLPAGYMGSFVHGIYAMLIKQFHNPDIAENAIIEYLAKLGRLYKLKAVPRETAESYIRSGIVLHGKQLLRTKLRHDRPGQTEHLEDVGEEAKQMSRDLEDPSALGEFKHILFDREPTEGKKIWNDLMQLAHKVHEDLPLYLELRMKGQSNDEIIGNPKKGKPGKLPHYKAPESGPTAWGVHIFNKWLAEAKAYLAKQHITSPEDFPEMETSTYDYA
jgi:hypothetical protein